MKKVLSLFLCFALLLCFSLKADTTNNYVIVSYAAFTNLLKQALNPHQFDTNAFPLTITNGPPAVISLNSTQFNNAAPYTLTNAIGVAGLTNIYFSALSNVAIVTNIVADGIRYDLGSTGGGGGGGTYNVTNYTFTAGTNIVLQQSVSGTNVIVVINDNLAAITNIINAISGIVNASPPGGNNTYLDISNYVGAVEGQFVSTAYAPVENVPRNLFAFGNGGKGDYKHAITFPAGTGVMGDGTTNLIMDPHLTGLTIYNGFSPNNIDPTNSAVDYGVHLAAGNTYGSGMSLFYSSMVTNGNGVPFELHTVDASLTFSYTNSYFKNGYGLLPGWFYPVMNYRDDTSRGFAISLATTVGSSNGNYSSYMAEWSNGVSWFPVWKAGVFLPSQPGFRGAKFNHNTGDSTWTSTMTVSNIIQFLGNTMNMGGGSFFIDASGNITAGAVNNTGTFRADHYLSYGTGSSLVTFGNAGGNGIGNKTFGLGLYQGAVLLAHGDPADSDRTKFTFATSNLFVLGSVTVTAPATNLAKLTVQGNLLPELVGPSKFVFTDSGTNLIGLAESGLSTDYLGGDGALHTLPAGGTSPTNTFDAQQFTLIQGTNVHLATTVVMTNLVLTNGYFQLTNSSITNYAGRYFQTNPANGSYIILYTNGGFAYTNGAAASQYTEFTNGAGYLQQGFTSTGATNTSLTASKIVLTDVNKGQKSSTFADTDLMPNSLTNGLAQGITNAGNIAFLPNVNVFTTSNLFSAPALINSLTPIASFSNSSPATVGVQQWGGIYIGGNTWNTTATAQSTNSGWFVTSEGIQGTSATIADSLVFSSAIGLNSPNTRLTLTSVGALTTAGSSANLTIGGSATVNGGITSTTGNITSTAGDVIISTAGKGLQIKGGSNAKIGTSVLVGGTVTVSTIAVTANSVVFLTVQVAGGTTGNLSIGTVTAGTSFVINSTSAIDTSTVGWVIIEKN